MLVGEGQYNLNVMKEIKVTDSYQGIGQDCQNVEPLQNCTTRHHIDTYLQNCGCLPFRMLLSDEVTIDFKNFYFHLGYIPGTSLQFYITTSVFKENGCWHTKLSAILLWTHSN